MFIVVYSGLYLYKSMIWGYPHFRKPPFQYLGNVWIIRVPVKIGEAVVWNGLKRQLLPHVWV